MVHILTTFAQERDDENWMKHTLSLKGEVGETTKISHRPVNMHTLDEEEMHVVPPFARVY